MDKNVTNKIVVVTGAANGIGFAIADNFLKKNTKTVILLDIKEEKGIEAASRLCAEYGKNKAVFIKCNVKFDVEEVFGKILNTYNHFDVLVNNAGICDETCFENCVDVNITAVIKFSLKYWETVRKDKGGPGGTIINISSIYGYRMNQFISVYQASKFAVLGFSRSLGHFYNFNKSGVRVLAICPGITETSISEGTKIPEKKVAEDFFEWLQTHSWQTSDAVGKGTVLAFEEADSGTAWLIENSKSNKEVILLYSE